VEPQHGVEHVPRGGRGGGTRGQFAEALGASDVFEQLEQQPALRLELQVDRLSRDARGLRDLAKTDAVIAPLLEQSPRRFEDGRTRAGTRLRAA
jgi:hypothetical protein